MKRLKNKIAVVYGDGAVDGAMAKAFAQEGAEAFLAGLRDGNHRCALAKWSLTCGN